MDIVFIKYLETLKAEKKQSMNFTFLWYFLILCLGINNLLKWILFKSATTTQKYEIINSKSCNIDFVKIIYETTWSIISYKDKSTVSKQTLGDDIK